MSSFTRMTAAMFELPFRMLELPFITLAVFMDALLSAEEKDSASNGKRSAPRARKGVQGAAGRVARVKVVPHERHAA